MSENDLQLFPFLLGGTETFRDVYGTLELSEEFRHSDSQTCVVLCVLDIPAMIIPKVFLQFLHPEKESIEVIRIYRHYLNHEKYLGLLFFKTLEAATDVKQFFLRNNSLNVLCSASSQLFFVNAISIQTFHDHVPLIDFSLLLDHQFHENGFKTFSNSLKPHPDQKLEESRQDCPLCLEAICPNNSRSIILYCSHQFHIDCLIKISNSQCPVCRFNHENILCQQTTCNTCGFAHKNQPPPNSLPPKSPHQTYDPDIWMCLTCGYSGCGEQHANHIYQHYQETSHNYVMNTHFRHKIYDFIRDNFVHRLILMDSSVNNLAENTINPFKLGDSSCEDLLLEHEDEQLVVGTKLEELVRQYQQLLIWRMSQSREFYNQKLRQIWSAVTEDGGTKDIDHIANEKLSFDKNKTWTKCIKSSLNTEHSKLTKQVEFAQEKLNRLHKEKDILEALHNQLLLNKKDLLKKIQEEEALVVEAENFGRDEIQLLEEKVNQLMVQVASEESPSVSTCPGSSSSSSRRNRRGQENNTSVGSD